ncbi:MAG: cold shock domain-containing protein [Pseudomonadales bacterium]|nr:cold shock domain-containing protein [Pseudomonadales bacterium]
MACFILACVASVLIGELLPNNTAKSGNTNTKKPATNKSNSEASSDNDADREEGSVKWFNVSKGFGFITRENGEDIFVHYRSIRGQGRRRLFDGQAVTFAVIDSDKGLQADDVDVIS